MDRRASILAVSAAVAMTVSGYGCSKAPEQRAAEKAVESALSKDGTKANVDLSSNAVRITTTDASGKTVQMEMGAAKVTEADVGVPFYPGAKPAEAGGSVVRTADGSATTMLLHSTDPVDKVAAFYRDHFKGQAAGRQMMESSAGDTVTLMLIDEQAKSSTQVHVLKGENGTDVQIASSRSAAGR